MICPKSAACSSGVSAVCSSGVSASLVRLVWVRFVFSKPHNVFIIKNIFLSCNFLRKWKACQKSKANKM